MNLLMERQREKKKALLRDNQRKVGSVWKTIMPKLVTTLEMCQAIYTIILLNSSITPPTRVLNHTTNMNIFKCHRNPGEMYYHPSFTDGKQRFRSPNPEHC